jgi:hypothetical protein
LYGHAEGLHFDADRRRDGNCGTVRRRRRRWWW